MKEPRLKVVHNLGRGSLEAHTKELKLEDRKKVPESVVHKMTLRWAGARTKALLEVGHRMGPRLEARKVEGVLV